MSDRPTPAPPRKLRSRAYHHGNLRSALLEAALAELGVAGMRELSLRNLAGRVGVSHAAPYRHFRNKRALLAALAEEAHRALREQLTQAMSAAESAAQRRLYAVALAYVRFALQSPSRFQLLLVNQEADTLRDAADATLDVLAQAAASDMPSPAARRALGTLVWATLHGLAELALAGQIHESDAEVLERLVALVVLQLTTVVASDELEPAGALLAGRARRGRAPNR